LNRYGYVANNPTNAYDPSGYVNLFTKAITPRVYFLAVIPAVFGGSLVTLALIASVVVSINLASSNKYCATSATEAWCKYQILYDNTKSLGEFFRDFGKGLIVAGIVMGVIGFGLTLTVGGGIAVAAGGVIAIGGEVLKDMGEDIIEAHKDNKRIDLIVHAFGQGFISFKPRDKDDFSV
jgi:hypothetical protein